MVRQAIPVCCIITLRADAAEAFGQSIGDWPAFPDSAAALSRLKALGLKIVVLSNVDNDSFARRVSTCVWCKADGQDKSETGGWVHFRRGVHSGRQCV